MLWHELHRSRLAAGTADKSLAETEPRATLQPCRASAWAHQHLCYPRLLAHRTCYTFVGPELLGPRYNWGQCSFYRGRCHLRYRTSVLQYRCEQLSELAAASFITQAFCRCSPCTLSHHRPTALQLLLALARAAQLLSRPLRPTILHFTRTIPLRAARRARHSVFHLTQACCRRSPCTLSYHRPTALQLLLALARAAQLLSRPLRPTILHFNLRPALCAIDMRVVRCDPEHFD